MTGPKDIVISILSLLLVVAGVIVLFQRSSKATLKANIQVYEQREKNWKRSISDCSETIADLQKSIDIQNESKKLAAEMGQEARKAQIQADKYARRLAESEERLDRLLESQRQFEELASSADTCQTYELVLKSIAGELP